MTISDERASIQNPLIKYCTEINRTYNPDDALTLRGGVTGKMRVKDLDV